jgi:hypothetical protein
MSIAARWHDKLGTREGESQRGFPRILYVVFPVFYTWFSPYEIRGFPRIILSKGFSPLTHNLFLTLKCL